MGWDLNWKNEDLEHPVGHFTFYSILFGFLSFCPREDDWVVSERMCFFDKRQDAIFVFDEGKDFLMVNRETLMGTEYLLTEKGYLQKNEAGELAGELKLMITATANFEANSIKLNVAQDLEEPLPAYAGKIKKGIQYKGLALKRCSCSRGVFKVLKDLNGFYPSATEQKH